MSNNNLDKSNESNKSNKSLVTIVTGYFTIPSKFPNNTYLQWIKNFMSLSCNMIIYTDNTNFNYIRQLRKDDNTVIIKRELKDFYVAKYEDYFKYCKSIDNESKHTPELYMVWAEKTFMTYDAIKDNPFMSDYFLWVDIGCIRDTKMLRNISSFPNDTKIKTLFPNNKFVLTTIKNFYNDNFSVNTNGIAHCLENINGLACKKLDRIQGTFFGGHINMWEKWRNSYDNELLLYIKTNTYGGKDQYIMSNIYIKDKQTNNPYIHIRAANNKIVIGATGKTKIVDIWFSFLYELS